MQFHELKSQFPKFTCELIKTMEKSIETKEHLNECFFKELTELIAKYKLSSAKVAEISGYSYLSILAYRAKKIPVSEEFYCHFKLGLVRYFKKLLSEAEKDVKETERRFNKIGKTMKDYDFVRQIRKKAKSAKIVNGDRVIEGSEK